MKFSQWILKYQKANDYPDLLLAQDWALRAAKLEAPEELLRVAPDGKIHSAGKVFAGWVKYIEYVARLQERYNELIMYVATKHPGESRHETAVRYISERENQNLGPNQGAVDA